MYAVQNTVKINKIKISFPRHNSFKFAIIRDVHIIVPKNTRVCNYNTTCMKRYDGTIILRLSRVRQCT